MYNDNQSQRRMIETTLARALDAFSAQEVAADAFPPPLEAAGDNYSAKELLQLAYDSVEAEIDELRSELRLLRQKHRAEEDRIQRRIIQKDALRRKILDAAPLENGTARSGD